MTPHYLVSIDAASRELSLKLRPAYLSRIATENTDEVRADVQYVVAVVSERLATLADKRKRIYAGTFRVRQTLLVR